MKSGAIPDGCANASLLPDYHMVHAVRPDTAAFRAARPLPDRPPRRSARHSRMHLCGAARAQCGASLFRARCACEGQLFLFSESHGAQRQLPRDRHHAGGCRRASERTDTRAMSVTLDGGETCIARAKRRKLRPPTSRRSMATCCGRTSGRTAGSTISSPRTAALSCGGRAERRESFHDTILQGSGADHDKRSSIPPRQR